jgi:hypothetical protein
MPSLIMDVVAVGGKNESNFGARLLRKRLVQKPEFRLEADAPIFGSPRKEGMYTTLLMSTGLTFGTISSLFGLTHGIIDQAQYSGLVAAVIGSAVVPTLIANAFYLPQHLLPDGIEDKQEVSSAASAVAEHATRGAE